MSRPIPISPHHFDLLRYNREAELIPGLPDCLALECLIRVPFHAILDARAVCKRWKHELDSPFFYRIRRAAGLAPCVVTLLFRGKLPHTVGKFHLALYEPDTGVFTMRQLASNRPNFKKGIRIHAMVVGRELVVIGGWDVLENRSTAEVNIYDLLSGAWRPGAPNPAPGRTCCVYGLKGGKVFVVGGRVKKLVYDVAAYKWFDRDVKGNKLRSALVYDVAADTWLEIPDLGQDECQGTSINGSFCSKFWQTREEYNNAIQYCRELLLLDDKSYLRMTKDGKEIAICVRKGKVMMEEIRLSDDVLGTLQQRGQRSFCFLAFASAGYFSVLTFLLLFASFLLPFASGLFASAGYCSTKSIVGAAPLAKSLRSAAPLRDCVLSFTSLSPARPRHCRKHTAPDARLHEAYYSAHRATSEDGGVELLKKKTPLPYRCQGLFGCSVQLLSCSSGFESSPLANRSASALHGCSALLRLASRRLQVYRLYTVLY
ncbi:hypothetical protein ZIOFF_045228 [Zingiber officinale]|uniref:F-box domain-containing protein n=1 Tax=Zingiber officinale TaxID=94328 RepID=A0A8J5G7F9_ZINOF|nr:hypothetical protein ZIOFF_045228 [Zingiber officinale]